MADGFKRNCSFEAVQFQGTVIVSMNAPMSEEIAEYLLKEGKEKTGPVLHAFACAARQNGKAVRDFLQKKRELNANRNGDHEVAYDSSQDTNRSGEEAEDADYLSRVAD